MGNGQAGASKLMLIYPSIVSWGMARAWKQKECIYYAALIILWAT
jgi:hypothetical protein